MHENKVPEDSVLRRHYETHQKMMGASGDSSAHGASSRTTGSNAPAQSSGGGFMGWLKRLFGG
jgi:hypothetical protein